MSGGDLVGRTVGNYRVTRKLGDGGMGAVYEAIHPEIARRVAVKVILPELARNEQVVARFLREGRAANICGHAGLVEILDLGRLPDGELYLVMELLHGESLGDRLTRAGALPLPEALRILDECCDALDALHRAGMVHRDLKPDNIFLIDGMTGPGSVKILDFGIVKVLEPDGARTAASDVLGTPLYMAPEQCRGAREVDARADVYAMGCVLHCMVTGRPPFDAASAQEAIYMHVMAPPPDLGIGHPASVASAISRALAKDPAERFGTAGELARSARGALAPAPLSRPVRAGPAARTVPASTGVHAKPRRPFAWSLIAAIGTVATALALALVGSRWKATSPKATPDALPSSAPAVPGDSHDALLPDVAASEVETARALAAAEGMRAWTDGRLEESMQSFRHACELGDPAACESLFYVMARGGADEKHWPGIMQEVGANCPEHPATCLGLAAPTMDRSTGLRACEAGVPSGCLIVAVSSVGADRDRWVQRGLAMVDDDRHVNAGYLLGVLATFGIGGTADPRRGRMLLAGACAAGDETSCLLVECMSFDEDAGKRLRALAACQDRQLVGTLLFVLSSGGS